MICIINVNLPLNGVWIWRPSRILYIWIFLIWHFRHDLSCVVEVCTHLRMFCDTPYMTETKKKIFRQIFKMCLLFFYRQMMTRSVVSLMTTDKFVYQKVYGYKYVSKWWVTNKKICFPCVFCPRRSLIFWMQENFAFKNNIQNDHKTLSTPVIMLKMMLKIAIIEMYYRKTLADSRRWPKGAHPLSFLWM